MMTFRFDNSVRRLIPAVAFALLLTVAVFSIPFASTADDRKTASGGPEIESFFDPRTNVLSPSENRRSPDDVFETLQQSIEAAGEGAKLSDLSAAELSAATPLFAETLSRKSGLEPLQSSWIQWKMELVKIPFGDEELWLLQELPDARRGRGVYVFRQSPTLPIVLQAPHSGFDQHTGEIVARLFAEGGFTCAAWNSIGREQIDFAHSEGTYFQALTQAVGESFPEMLVVQIHGFDERKRETAAGKKASLIVSNGTVSPPRWFLQSALVFGREFPDKSVLVYPFDTSELGATTNSQARVLRSQGNYSFLHLECNRSFRKAARDDSAHRSELTQCLREFVRTNTVRE